VGGNNLTFENITITGASNDEGTGINARQVNGLTINNMTISNIYDAIGVGGGANTVISNSSLHDLGRNAMSFFQSAEDIKVINNNMTKGQYGIFFGGGVRDIEIINNNITAMDKIAIALVKSAESALIKDNFVSNNTIGVVIKAGDTNHGEPTRVNDITIENNNISLNDLIGILLENVVERSVGTEIIIDENNEIKENGYPFRDNMGWATGSKGWDNEIGDSFNIVKNYYKEDLNPNLSISNSISKSTVKNGDKITYTVTVKNTGDGASKAITVNPGISSAIGSASATYKTSGSYSNNKWTINSLGAGDTAVLVLEVSTKKAGVKNIASSLNSDGAVKTGNTNKLTINKDVKLSSATKISKTTIKKGKTTTISTTLKNTGIDESDKMYVKISLPKDVKVKAVNQKSYYNKKTNQWTMKVPAKKSVKLNMNVAGSKKGTKKIVINVNGKKQTKKIKIV
jgi:uncharacterized repeat protein (TIGR01451 family)